MSERKTQQIPEPEPDEPSSMVDNPLVKVELGSTKRTGDRPPRKNTRTLFETESQRTAFFMRSFPRHRRSSDAPGRYSVWSGSFNLPVFLAEVGYREAGAEEVGVGLWFARGGEAPGAAAVGDADVLEARVLEPRFERARLRDVASAIDVGPPPGGSRVWSMNCGRNHMA